MGIAPEDVDNVIVTTSPDGKTTTVRKRVKVIVRHKDGKMTTEDFRGMPAEIPEVSSMNCRGDDKTHQMVMNESKDGKHRIIICTDRIERVARESAAVAANSADIQRKAYRSALDGLHRARAGVAGNMSMAAEARAEALKGIDEAIKEVAEDMAKAD
jgi:hypothetical protein